MIPIEQNASYPQFTKKMPDRQVRHPYKKLKA
jgi:hypothetical protein